jgi:plastocyanin
VDRNHEKIQFVLIMQSSLVKLAESAIRLRARGWAAAVRIERLSSAVFLTCFCLGTSRAADVQVELADPRPSPENVAVYVGDTVTWNAQLVVDTESYTGEWKSPILKVGETFSYTFTKPGTYAYRIGWYSGSTPPSSIAYYVGTVAVQPLAGPRPAVSIATPPDGFMVPGSFVLLAVVTNSESNVKAVIFYKEDQAIATVTNAPYGITVPGDSNSRKTYEFRASVVDTTGLTNSSPPIRVTYDAFKMFNPFRLPGGQFVSFHSGPGSPDCVFWSEDLKLRNDPVVGQRLGRSTYVDETSTNAVQRFYRIEGCL